MTQERCAPEKWRKDTSRVCSGGHHYFNVDSIFTTRTLVRVIKSYICPFAQIVSFHAVAHWFTCWKSFLLNVRCCIVPVQYCVAGTAYGDICFAQRFWSKRLNVMSPDVKLCEMSSVTADAVQYRRTRRNCTAVSFLARYCWGSTSHRKVGCRLSWNCSHCATSTSSVWSRWFQTSLKP